MNELSRYVFMGLGAFLMFASETMAQSPQSAQAMLNAWDKNNNGLLERSEIPLSARGKFEVMAKRKGMNLDKGMPITLLLRGADAKTPKRATNALKKIATDKAAKVEAAKGKEIRYAEEKDMLTLEGDVQRPAQLWQRSSPTERGTSQGRVRRIRFWPKSEKAFLDGVLNFDVSAAPGSVQRQ